MEIIRNLVQSLVIIIILAMFLEMLLPAGEMRTYVKMIMGLLVIIAVVQAVGSIARWSFEEMPAVVTGAGDGRGQLPEILETGRKISARQQELGIEQYRQGLARQVTALVNLNQELPVLDVEVNVESESGKPGFGQIKEIILTVGENPEQAGPEPEGEKLVDNVTPVTVQVGSPGTPDKPGAVNPKAVAGIVGVLTNFYNIKPEQVKMIYN